MKVAVQLQTQTVPQIFFLDIAVTSQCTTVVLLYRMLKHITQIKKFNVNLIQIMEVLTT